MPSIKETERLDEFPNGYTMRATDRKYFKDNLRIVGDWVEFISNHVYRSARRLILKFLFKHHGTHAWKRRLSLWSEKWCS